MDASLSVVQVVSCEATRISVVQVVRLLGTQTRRVRGPLTTLLLLRLDRKSVV